MSLRRRVIFFYQQPLTLAAVKRWANRSVEIIAAQDLPTLEATLRLYSKIDGFVAERATPTDKSLDVSKFARDRRPDVRRILLVEQDAMAGVCEALHERVIAQMLFLPLSSDELSRALNIAVELSPAMPRQIQPPLTGGIRASSSPAFKQ